MKILKRIGIVLLILIAIPLIVALFVKKDYAVEKEIVINRPNAEVFEYIKHIKNQNVYSVWNKKDPNMKQTYTGEDGKVGFISAWESKNENVGVGEQEIVKIEEGKRIDMKLRFKEPFEAEDNAYMITESISDNKTKVKWGFTGKMPYPMNIMMLFMDMDEMIGKDLSEGLESLKTELEKQ